VTLAPSIPLCANADEGRNLLGRLLPLDLRPYARVPTLIRRFSSFGPPSYQTLGVRGLACNLKHLVGHL
jgi:hypothetical protein